MNVTFVTLLPLAVTTSRVVAELAEHGRVRVVEVRETGAASIRATRPWPSNVELHRVALDRHRPRLVLRIAPSHYHPRDESVLSAVLRLCSDADWVWLEGAPLPWLPAIRARLGAKPLLTWSEDSAARAALSSARVLGPRHPRRTAARLISGAVNLADERRFLRHVDVVLARSPGDVAWLKRATRANVVPLTNAVDLTGFAAARSKSVADTQPVATFIGSNYEPNLHGLRFLLQRVWPAVLTAVPRARLVVAGRGLDAQLVGDRPGIEFLGEVESVGTLLADARVLACPIFYGAGLPLKVLDGGAAARPTIITPFVARSLGGADGFLVAESVADWVRTLVEMLTDPGAAEVAGAAALRRVRDDFSLEVWREELAAIRRP